MEPPIKVIKLEQQSPLVNLPFPDEVITEKDLPLLANIGDVRVHHYLLKLSLDFSKKVVNGCAILFLEWSRPRSRSSSNPTGTSTSVSVAGPGPSRNQNKIVLDQCFLKIKRVDSLRTGKHYDALQKLTDFDNGSGNRKHFYCSDPQIDWFEVNESFSEQLTFTQNKWSVTIQGWKEDDIDLDPRPTVLRIDYETLETSPSIHWRPCDGFNYKEASYKCCYTPAPAVNNRGLFPCQEPPSAMATWEVLLECDKEYTPLLTSDEPGEILGAGTGVKSIHYFYCSVPLPMSTFALVVGKFCLQTNLEAPPPEIMPSTATKDIKVLPSVPSDDENPCKHHPKYPCRFGHAHHRQQQTIPVRLFCLDPDTILLDRNKFTSLVYSSLTNSFRHFGPHPFSRLDIIIVPKSYPHVGLTSPSMTYLSPNNFYGNEPMYISRLPHEICHNYFGLLIGSLDWTEEWLSEGFATYCEDILFPSAFHTYFPDKNSEDIERDQALKILMRFTSLKNELKNTETELHIISHQNSPENSQKTAQNGLVPIKQFMHVHYYKGYLLLWHLASLVGQQEFLQFLKSYIWRYHGQLVTSQIFLDYYHSHFKSTFGHQDSEAVIETLKKDWLQSNKLPEPYNSLDLIHDDNLTDNSVPKLFAKAINPLKNIKLIYKNLLQDKPQVNFKLETLSCSELLLLMELILNELQNPDSSDDNRKALENIYFKYLINSVVFQNPDLRQNADVGHRWCELIIFFKDKSRLNVVESFLRNNIAMGVYLYGELMITERFTFQKKAKQLYHELQNVYDLATKKIVKEMVL